jgi:hypothetical protein
MADFACACAKTVLVGAAAGTLGEAHATAGRAPTIATGILSREAPHLTGATCKIAVLYKGMLGCPPGTVRNPYTARCVSIAGRRAKALLAGGEIGYGNMAAGYGWQRQTQQWQRQTQRRPRGNLAAAFGVQEERPLFRDEGVFRGQATAFAEPAPVTGCPPGTQRNPASGRCIKITGRTFKRLYPVAAPAPMVQEKPMWRQALIRPAIAALPEPEIVLPVGTASVAPQADRTTVLEWAAGQCATQRDAITGTPFTNMEAVQLQELVRLHNRTCTLATPLHTKVAVQHRMGEVATVPGSSGDHLTLDDFKALRTAMRRKNPVYKIPGRAHRPPPDSWKLYVASDARSGPDFASVLYVDVTRARMTATGPEYPLDSIKVDLGFIPLEHTDKAVCSPKMIVKFLDALSKTNRLLVPTAGGWKPVLGFPFPKSHWEKHRAEKISRLCADMARVLANPL